MPDQWTIRGQQFVNCNCNQGCPCQFGAPSTHGSCEASVGGHIDEGRFNDVSLDGLNFVMLTQWPHEIADGNGTQQFIIDERADASQREALGKILRGESTAPGATHFYVFASTMSKVLEDIIAPVDVEVDIAGRRARVLVPDLVDSRGEPIVDPNSGQEFHARIDLPNGFEYSVAEMGVGTSKVRAGINLNFEGSYGQFSELHMNQDGVIR